MFTGGGGTEKSGIPAGPGTGTCVVWTSGGAFNIAKTWNVSA